MAWTTSSELIGELGQALLVIQRTHEAALPPEVSRELHDAIAAARQVWPDLREPHESAPWPVCGEARRVRPLSQLMHQDETAIDLALRSGEPIPRDRVRDWIRASSAVETDGRLYALTREAWHRIEPRLQAAETCDLIQRYLFRCIEENPATGAVLTRWEAARELEAWFDHLADMEDARTILENVVIAVTDLFLRADADVRNAVETGFLEHVLEQARIRPLFSHWAEDPRLRQAFVRAVAWGKAHPDFTKGLRATLRTFGSNEG